MFLEDYNIDITFKITWARFLYLRKIRYTAGEKKKSTFVKIYLTRSNILFAIND